MRASAFLAGMVLTALSWGQGPPGGSPTYFAPGEIVEMAQMELEHHLLTASISVSGDAFPDTTTSALDDGFISGSNVNVVVTGSGGTKIGAPPGTPQPVVIETKVTVDDATVSRTPPQGFPNFCSPAGIRFSSLHFGHGTNVSLTGHAKFQVGIGTPITVPVSLTLTVYNRTIAWVHGDPAPSNSTRQQQLAAALGFKTLADKIALAMQNAGYEVVSSPVNPLSKPDLQAGLGPATSIMGVTHGSTTSLSTCTGLDATEETLSSAECIVAWEATPVTPMSHFSVVAACQTISSGGSAFASAIRTRTTGAYVGFNYPVPFADPAHGTNILDLFDHFFSFLAEGYAAGSAAQWASDDNYPYVLTIVGDQEATLGHVYLTADERNAQPNRQYANWHYIISEQNP